MSARGAVLCGVVAVTLVAAVAASALTRGGDASARIVVSSTHCGFDWRAPASGRTVFTVENRDAGHRLQRRAGSADQTRIFGQIETLNPSTELPLDVVLPPGEYAFVCATRSGYSLVSPSREVRGAPLVGAPSYAAVSPRTMQLAAVDYNHSLRPVMQRLVRDTDRLTASVRTGRLAEARRLWVAAHLDYAMLGVAYDTFGRFDDEINPQPFGLPGGVNDPNFRGFLRLEYGLWHGQSPAALAPIATALNRSVRGLLESFPKLAVPPGDLSLRAHEILENALQFELTSATDQGSPRTWRPPGRTCREPGLAVDALRPALSQADPQLTRSATSGLERLGRLLAAHRTANGSWTPLAALTTAQRQRINGATSSLLETLELIPGRLQPAPSGGDVD